MQRTQQRLPTATRVANASNSTPRDTTEEAVLPSPSKPQLSSPPSLSSSPASSVSSSKGNKGLPKATGAEKGMCVDAKSTQFSSKVSIPKGVTVRPRYVGGLLLFLMSSLAVFEMFYRRWLVHHSQLVRFSPHLQWKVAGPVLLLWKESIRRSV